MDSTPDLSSILRTLSTFANPASSPSVAVTASTSHHAQQHHHHPHRQQYQTHQQPRNEMRQTDPSQITTWPPALKHIMHLVSSNQSFSMQIQRLLKSQRDHERQWWSGREALVAQQRTRADKKRKLEAVLKSVGVPNTGGAAAMHNDMEIASTTTEYATELLVYDKKVYQASVDMARATEAELKRLGVPFFCLNASLLSPVAADTSTSASTEKKKESSTTKEEEKALLTRPELDSLKKRVLDLLVDLCT